LGTNQAKQKRQELNKPEIHVSKWCNFALFCLIFTAEFFLQIKQISVVLFLQPPTEQGLSFFAVGAHSATAALLSVCNLSSGVPLSSRQFFTNSLNEHSAIYAGIANVLANNPAINECHVYYIVKHVD